MGIFSTNSTSSSYNSSNTLRLPILNFFQYFTIANTSTETSQKKQNRKRKFIVQTLVQTDEAIPVVDSSFIHAVYTFDDKQFRVNKQTKIFYFSSICTDVHVDKEELIGRDVHTPHHKTCLLYTSPSPRDS